MDPHRELEGAGRATGILCAEAALRDPSILPLLVNPPDAEDPRREMLEVKEFFNKACPPFSKSVFGNDCV